MIFQRTCALGRRAHTCGWAVFLFVAFAGLALSQAAVAANITVANPVSGATVSAPVWVEAHNLGCYGLAPTQFGYSIDRSWTVTTSATAYDINVTNLNLPAGNHTIYFWSWTSHGQCPVVSTSFKVSNTTALGSVPANAVSSGFLDGVSTWEYAHDTGTPGESTGSFLYPATTPSSDTAQEFYMTYSDYGGERFHLSFGSDTNATHFVYDSYVYLVDPSQVQNLELDLNQVMANGDTVIFGTQCASGSKTWEYTTVSNGAPHWQASNISCNPANWAANTWHHVQIGSHRDSNGVVTYDWVNLDNTHKLFQNATGSSALSLGWPLGDLVTNFQIDGISSGSGVITAYVHNMVVDRW